MKNLILLGGGGHCESVIEVIQGLPEFKIIGILDPDLNQRKSSILDIPIIGDDHYIPNCIDMGYEFVITVGQIQTSRVRQVLYEKVKLLGGSFPVIKAQTAYVSPNSTIGEGTVIMHTAFVNVNSRIGNCCILNTGSLVEHGAVVKSFSHISTKAVLNGNVYLGKGSFLGSGSIVNQGIRIGDGCVVASGSLIRKDLPDHTKAAGNPIRIIK